MISEHAVIEDGATIGKNCFIGHFVVIRPGVVIGDNCSIRAHCFIAEGAKIGNNVKIIQGSNITKNAVIEDNVFIGPNVIMTDTNRISFMRDYPPKGEPPTIKSGTRIGGGARLLPGVVIEKNCLIGVGSVVTKSTEENGIYMGVPAKRTGTVPKEERL